MVVVAITDLRLRTRTLYGSGQIWTVVNFETDLTLDPKPRIHLLRNSSTTLNHCTVIFPKDILRRSNDFAGMSAEMSGARHELKVMEPAGHCWPFDSHNLILVEAVAAEVLWEHRTSCGLSDLFASLLSLSPNAMTPPQLSPSH